MVVSVHQHVTGTAAAAAAAAAVGALPSSTTFYLIGPSGRLVYK